MIKICKQYEEKNNVGSHRPNHDGSNGINRV